MKLKLWMSALIAVILGGLSNVHAEALPRDMSPDQAIEIAKQHVRYTFLDDHDTTVSCVERDFQPALLMSGEELATPPTIQLPPLKLAKNEVLVSPFDRCENRDRNGAAKCCPDGTVPLQLDSSESRDRDNTPDLSSLLAQGNEPNALTASYTNTANVYVDYEDPYGICCTYLLITNSINASYAYPEFKAQIYQNNLPNTGAQATFNVWAPYTQNGPRPNDENYPGTTDLSRSFLSIENSSSGSKRHYLQVGWLTSYTQFGDYNAHLVARSSSFTTTTTTTTRFEWATSNTAALLFYFSFYNPNFQLGAPLTASTSGGGQHVVTAGWYEDPVSGAWWLTVNNQWIGYISGKYFDVAGTTDDLYFGASRVQFGGDVWIGQWNTTAMTNTDMGNGKFPSSTYSANASQVAYQDRMIYFTKSGTKGYSNTVVPYNWYKYITNSNCYNAQTFSGQYKLYFGGSGKNTYCQ